MIRPPYLFSLIAVLLSCSSPKAIDSSTTLQEPSQDTQEPEPSSDTSSDDIAQTSEPEVFSLFLQVEEASQGGLELSTNLPMYAQDCVQASYQNLTCDDADEDGFTDAWETLVIEHIRPILSLDEQEPFPNDPQGVFAQIARLKGTQDWIDVFIVLAWSKDYGRCGISGHPGDSERVAIRLRPDRERNAVSFYSVYTAAHEGEITDAGRVWTEGELNELHFTLDPNSGLPRWVVFPSEGKHATFATIEHCESVSILPCLDEDCAPDNVSNPDDWWLFGPVINAGEENHPLADDLTILGFPNESAWGEQDFCGGLGQDGCSSPIREKLIDNPFD